MNWTSSKTPALCFRRIRNALHTATISVAVIPRYAAPPKPTATVCLQRLKTSTDIQQSFQTSSSGISGSSDSGDVLPSHASITSCGAFHWRNCSTTSSSLILGAPVSIPPVVIDSATDSSFFCELPHTARNRPERSLALAIDSFDHSLLLRLHLSRRRVQRLRRFASHERL